MIDLTEDVDDVEGHGLKEIAAGLGAAAVLVGGAAGAAQLGGSTTTTGAGGGPLPGVVQVVQETVGAQTADHGRGALLLQQAEQTAGDAQQEAVDTVRDTLPLTQPLPPPNPAAD